MKNATVLVVVVIVLGVSAFGSSSVTIPVGLAPIFLAANPTTNMVYVSNLNSNSVSVINGASNTVVATVPLDGSPDGIDVNATTNMIYVAEPEVGHVAVIDGSTNAIVTTITGVGAFQVRANAATNLIYVANAGQKSGQVSVIDGTTNTITATIQVGAGAFGIDINFPANLVYVANTFAGTISVIDGSNNAVTNTFTLPRYAYPQHVAFDQVSNRLYGSDGGNEVVYVVNATTGKSIYTRGGKVPFTSPADAAVLQPGKLALISDEGRDNCLWEIEESTNAVVGSFTGVNGPIGVAVNSTTHKIYVANNGNSTVSVFSY